MDLGLRGRVALVTGAAGGIGAAAARCLAAEGARLVLADREADAVDRLAASLREGGADVACAPADVTDEAAVQASVDAAAARFGQLDVLIGCAGISGPVGTVLADTAAADWRRVIDVNVTGTFLMLRAAVPLLRASAVASVVLVASDSALVAAPGMVAYCASKAAVVQLARAASVELAADGIRVNVVCPSVVDTPMSRGDLGLADGFAGVGYPVQTADDIAGQLAWLASPRSRGVNAAALVADFGYSARSNFPA